MTLAQLQAWLTLNRAALFVSTSRCRFNTLGDAISPRRLFTVEIEAPTGCGFGCHADLDIAVAGAIAQLEKAATLVKVNP